MARGGWSGRRQRSAPRIASRPWSLVSLIFFNRPPAPNDNKYAAIQAAGAELRYLPPYSPDMNPIEKAFSKLKAFLRKISERTVAGLMNALETCAHIFKPMECVNYLKACGYDTD